MFTCKARRHRRHININWKVNILPSNCAVSFNPAIRSYSFNFPSASRADHPEPLELYYSTANYQNINPLIISGVPPLSPITARAPHTGGAKAYLSQSEKPLTAGTLVSPDGTRFITSSYLVRIVQFVGKAPVLLLRLYHTPRKVESP